MFPVPEVPSNRMCPTRCLMVSTDHLTMTQQQVILGRVTSESFDAPLAFPDAEIALPTELLHSASSQGEGIDSITSPFGQPEDPQADREVHFERDNLNLMGEEDGWMHETASVWITRPLDDAILLAGHVVVAFETRGFMPSKETPIEVSDAGGGRQA